MKSLTFHINDEIAYECDRQTTLDTSQLGFLDKMDSDMNRGFKINGQLCSEPDLKQRARFVTMNLLKALQQDNQSVIAASCAYLTQRLPALVEIHIKRQQNNPIEIEFVEEH